MLPDHRQIAVTLKHVTGLRGGGLRLFSNINRIDTQIFTPAEGSNLTTITEKTTLQFLFILTKLCAPNASFFMLKYKPSLCCKVIRLYMYVSVIFRSCDRPVPPSLNFHHQHDNLHPNCGNTGEAVSWSTFHAKIRH